MIPKYHFYLIYILEIIIYHYILDIHSNYILDYISLYIRYIYRYNRLLYIRNDIYMRNDRNNFYHIYISYIYSLIYTT